MRNRRIIDELRGRRSHRRSAIESDSVAGLYAHLPGGRWSSVISHAWLHMFGVPEGMRVVPLEGRTRGDVWYPRPAPADHPWRTMPHHGMTPHISGSSLSAQAR
jgi:hypothetical protein